MFPSLSCERGQAKTSLSYRISFVSVQKHAKGQDLLKKVCDHLNLLEEDYFGLAIWDTPTSRVSGCCGVVFCTRVGSALSKDHLPLGGHGA